MKKYILSVLLLIIFAAAAPQMAEACSPCDLEGNDGSGLYANDAKRLCGVFTQETFGGTCGCSRDIYARPEGWRGLPTEGQGFAFDFRSSKDKLTDVGEKACGALGYSFVQSNIGKRTAWGYAYFALTTGVPILSIAGAATVIVAIIGLVVIALRKRRATAEAQVALTRQMKHWRRYLVIGAAVFLISVVIYIASL